MKRANLFITVLFVAFSLQAKAQTSQPLKLSGYLQTDQRILTKSPNDWVWNENRLSLQLEKKISGKAKFYSEVWLRNIGIPKVTTASDLYNKGIIDPWNLEIREAYVQLYGFLTKNLDVTIGRQRIAWGTADKINPTDNLNPYDFEDILDFGRHRGSDALNLHYWLSANASFQVVYLPFFQPDNLPIGIFADIFSSPVNLSFPEGMTLQNITTRVNAPKYNLKEGSTLGVKYKGMISSFNFSLSYVWGWDGLPMLTDNTFTLADTLGGVNINSILSYHRRHIFGADLAGNIGGVGVWAEAACFVPVNEVVMTTDLSALFPGTPYPVIYRSTELKKQAYFRYVVGGDYYFKNNGYLNVQFLHGFVNESGRGNLNDYLFLRYEQKFFNDKFKICPLSGAVVVSNWHDIKHNYAIVYMPEISYMATENTEISVSGLLFNGKGNDLFASFNGYDMLLFKMKYSF
ncbi:MAG: hypothetical protein IH595_05890 [Bacteroidales bacterium]|nr:hypothetical protein [Bacteroidales bacterium]